MHSHDIKSLTNPTTSSPQDAMDPNQVQAIRMKAMVSSSYKQQTTEYRDEGVNCKL
jgi:hypothetical protein